MKRALKKGFTLIELMVVIAIIGILATTLAPKLREQLAKAKDSKAVSFLGASRTVASSLIISNMTNGSSDEILGITWKNLSKQLDVTTSGLISKDGNLIIGGSKGANDKMVYGGAVELHSKTDLTSPSNTKGYVSRLSLDMAAATTAGVRDASDLELVGKDLSTTATVTAEKKSTEGKEWTAY